MKKYLLTFKNQKIEEKYQNECVGQTRMKMFKLIVILFLITFSIRVAQGILNKNYQYAIINVIMMAYLIIQYAIAKKYNNLLRISLVLVNHALTVCHLLIEESPDTYSAYLRGVNHMGTNLLIIFSGEYAEAVISLFSVQVIRITIVSIKSNDIEYFTIVGALFLVGYASKQLHEYHKGLRSQFLLSIKEKQWDNIFAQIIKEIPYLLMTFDEENLKYEISSIQNCGKFIENNEEAIQFLRNSTAKGQSLEQLIYQEIRLFQTNCQENFNNITNICINKQQLLLQYSIFNGNQPIILFIFKDLIQKFKQEHNQSNQQYQAYFFDFFFKLCSKLQRVQEKNYYLRKIYRKLYVIKSLSNFSYDHLISQKIDMCYFFLQLQRLYPNKKLNYQAVQNSDLHSILPLIQIFFIITLESLQSQGLSVYQRTQLHQYLELKLVGKFDSYEIKQFYSKYIFLFNLIISSIKITDEIISFYLFQSAFVPYLL